MDNLQVYVLDETYFHLLCDNYCANSWQDSNSTKARLSFCYFYMSVLTNLQESKKCICPCTTLGCTKNLGLWSSLYHTQNICYSVYNTVCLSLIKWHGQWSASVNTNSVSAALVLMCTFFSEEKRVSATGSCTCLWYKCTWRFVCVHQWLNTIEWKKDMQQDSTCSYCVKLKSNYSCGEPCHLALVISFGVKVCAFLIG